MQRAVRFLLVLMIGLALLTMAGHATLSHTTGKWFERDLTLRSSLAVPAARQGLIDNWAARPERLDRTLADITRDERIMGAAACTFDGKRLASTDGYPNEFSCQSVLERMRRETAKGTSTWAMTTDLPSGRVNLSVTLIDDHEAPLGAIVLVHDLSFLARREATTRNLLIGAFFVMALGASVVTLIAARIAWREWTRELRQALSGKATALFQPLVGDVRSLVERLSNEREREARGGLWSPQRLSSALMQYLHGERVVILANREPYIHEKGAEGVRVIHPASGLVTALEPVMRACSGVWVAHGSGSADRETVDAHDRVRVPPGEESYQVRRVWLSDAEEKGYYYGFSNEGLWPLCHVAHTRPVFRAEDYEHYVRVNRKFADAVCEEVDSDDPIILVQDYHFALAPKMIRDRLPRATIITFWHTPLAQCRTVGDLPLAR